MQQRSSILSYRNNSNDSLTTKYNQFYSSDFNDDKSLKHNIFLLYKKKKFFVIFVTISLVVLFLFIYVIPRPKVNGLRKYSNILKTKEKNKNNIMKTEDSIKNYKVIPFDIMTFNLRYATESDGYNSWTFRKDHVVDIISRYHPFVFGTQEGLSNQLNELHFELKKKNPSYERYGEPREDNGEYEQIFYDTKYVKKLDGGNFWHSDTPEISGEPAWGAACVRMTTWCKFLYHGGKLTDDMNKIDSSFEFYFFNTQLDHVNEYSRDRSVQLIWEKLIKIISQDKVTSFPLVFIVGDFNTYHYTNVYKYLTKEENGPKLSDAWINTKNQVGSVSYTYHGFQGIYKPEEKNAIKGENHIDWILYKTDNTSKISVNCIKTVVITETRENGRYPSDHYPILANLEIFLE